MRKFGWILLAFFLSFAVMALVDYENELAMCENTASEQEEELMREVTDWRDVAQTILGTEDATPADLEKWYFGKYYTPGEPADPSALEIPQADRIGPI